MKYEEHIEYRRQNKLFLDKLKKMKFSEVSPPLSEYVQRNVYAMSNLEQPVTQVEDGAKVLPMTPIKGYSPINTAQQQMVNANKELEEQILRILDTLKEKDVDQRWLAIARTHFEQGYMALNRSIFKPKRVSLPGDEAPQ